MMGPEQECKLPRVQLAKYCNAAHGKAVAHLDGGVLLVLGVGVARLLLVLAPHPLVHHLSENASELVCMQNFRMCCIRLVSGGVGVALLLLILVPHALVLQDPFSTLLSSHLSCRV